MSDIKEFNGFYRFLSNFWPAIVALDGQEYPSVEHAYQAAKTLDPAERDIIKACVRPGQAKRAGQKVTMRYGWERVKFDIMYNLVSQKFQHEDLRRQLLTTADGVLIEGNHWNDTTWGVCNDVGKNWLGVILMWVRARAQQEAGQ